MPAIHLASAMYLIIYVLDFDQLESNELKLGELMMKVFYKAAMASMLAIAVAGTASAATTMYTDRAAFEAAAGALTTEDFSGAPSSAFTYGVHGGTVAIAGGASSYAVNGTDYLDTDIAGTPIDPGTLTITFTSAITAFGADFFSLNNNVPRTYLNVGGTEFNPLPDSPAFLGFISDTGFTTVTFFNPLDGGNDDHFGLDNLSYGAAPEPASWAMMLGGFGAIGGAMRSRRKAAVSFG